MNIYAFADESCREFDGQIEAMKRNGLNGLEMRRIGDGTVAELTLEQAGELRRKMDDAGLVTWSIGSKLGKIDIEKDDLQGNLEDLRHLLDVAHIMGASRLRLFSFYCPADRDPAIFKNKVIDRLGQFLDVARNSGVQLCHENEKGIYGDIASRCLELHQALPELGGIFDPANFVQCHQDTLEAWDMLHSHITYMHIKDAKSDGRVVPAGLGLGNVQQIVKLFREQGGQDFTMEPHLFRFAGLKGLERAHQLSSIGNDYPTAESAFDAACAAFKALI